MSKGNVIRLAKARKCECEHYSHFEKDARTPSGNPGHDYGREVLLGVVIESAFGDFFTCCDCAADCRRED